MVSDEPFPRPAERIPLPFSRLAFVLVALAFAAPAAAQEDPRFLLPPAPDAKPPKAWEVPQFREELRKLVEGLAQYAEARDPKFVIVGRNPLGLMATSNWEIQRQSLVDPKAEDRDPIPDTAPGAPFRRILRDLDAVALDDLDCPKPKPQPDAPQPTPAQIKAEAAREAQIKAIRAAGTPILGLDRCALSHYELARKGRAAKVLSVAAIGAPDAPKRMPSERPPYENSDGVTVLADARNAYWLRSPRAYGSKADWLAAAMKSNADLLIVDAFYAADQPLTKADVTGLKYKFMGPRRLVLAEIDLTAARDDRYYWKREWRIGETPILREPLRDHSNGALANYWLKDWKDILGQYFVGLMDLGFDGVLLEGLEAADRLEYEVILE